MTLQPENWEKPQNILVILAHPDDPEFFCGATIARWTAGGHRVTYQLLCCGDKGWNPKSPAGLTSDQLCGLRREEQANAGKILGVKDIQFLDHQDGLLVPDLDLRKEIVRIIRKFKPDILVTCDPQNLFATYGLNHPDHRAAGQAVLDAVFPAAGNLFYYPDLLAEGYQPHSVKEVWVTLTNQPDVTLEVTEYWETKIKAVLQHTSQVQVESELINRLRSRRTQDSSDEKPRYEEKFKRVLYS
jgi:LmbE family N-acetylglucosaminyl deacetylase